MTNPFRDYVPIAQRGDLVAKIRTDYLNGATIKELCEKYDHCRPTIRGVLDDETINCPVSAVAVRRPGRRKQEERVA